MRALLPSRLGQNFAFERDGSKARRSHVTPTGTAFFNHGRDSGSYTHVQRARVTVRVNAGVHRGLGAIMPKKSRKKNHGIYNLVFKLYLSIVLPIIIISIQD